ncbi:hypothetical protein [Kitasatospora sp. NPDC004289]
MTNLPFHTPADPDPDFPATWQGGHALILGYGDCEFIAQCQCGQDLGTGRPDTPLGRFATAWERHVMALPAV